MTTVKQAVILAGGLGTRLGDLTKSVPKPMVLVNERPFLEYLIELLKENGIEEIVLLLGYLSDVISDHFGDGSAFGIKITYSMGAVEDDTGARIRNAKDLLDDVFLLMYCDNYWPLNLEKLLAFRDQLEVLATVTVYTNKDNFTRNNMLVDEDGFVVTYDRSRTDPDLNGVDIGYFLMDKKIVDMMPEENFNIADVTIPQLVEMRQLRGYRTDHRYYSIGYPERIPITEEFLRPKKVIFLDRDGVINEKAPKADYVKTWDEFRFLPGVLDAIRTLTEHGYDIYLISNQAGIARGMMTEDDLSTIHANMQTEIEANGGRIAGIYYCPHGWDDNCECRKPKPGMFYRAGRDHGINLTKTVFIGDDERDKEAGDAAGVETVLVTDEKNLLDVITELLEKDTA
jgi:D-glycero-D-manno-heptose 1,7-bisphosphate phosphatase